MTTSQPRSGLHSRENQSGTTRVKLFFLMNVPLLLCSATVQPHRWYQGILCHLNLYSLLQKSVPVVPTAVDHTWFAQRMKFARSTPKMCEDHAVCRRCPMVATYMLPWRELRRVASQHWENVVWQQGSFCAGIQLPLDCLITMIL